MPSTFPCATCGTLLSGINTFEYQKHMTQCHWPGKNNVFPLSSIFTSSSTPVPSPSAPSVHSVLGKRKRSTDDDDDSGSAPLRVRVDSTLAGSTAGSVSGTSITPSSPANITPKVADFLASVGVDPSQIGKRVCFTLVRR
jgi:hypothetical protein